MSDQEKNIGLTNSDRETQQSALITVCDSCLQASCFQGEFYCEEYKTAGTTQKTRVGLAALKRENPRYWKTDEELGLSQIVEFPEVNIH